MNDYQPIASAPRDGTQIEVLVPTRDGGLIAGRAYFDASAYDGSWWWAGTSIGEYHQDPIREINHGDPLFWRRETAPAAEVRELIVGMAEVLMSDCGVPPCVGSMAPAEDLTGRARRLFPEAFTD